MLAYLAMMADVRRHKVQGVVGYFGCKPMQVIHNALRDFRKKPIKKQLIVLWFLVFLNFFTSTYLALAIDKLWILVLGLAIVFFWASLLRAMNCPRCEWPVFRHRVTRFGVEWEYFGGWPVRSQCENCGLDFRRVFACTDVTRPRGRSPG